MLRPGVSVREHTEGRDIRRVAGGRRWHGGEKGTSIARNGHQVGGQSRRYYPLGLSDHKRQASHEKEDYQRADSCCCIGG